jgi:hypothetical protein
MPGAIIASRDIRGCDEKIGKVAMPSFPASVSMFPMKGLAH